MWTHAQILIHFHTVFELKDQYRQTLAYEGHCQFYKARFSTDLVHLSPKQKNASSLKSLQPKCFHCALNELISGGSPGKENKVLMQLTGCWDMLF